MMASIKSFMPTSSFLEDSLAKMSTRDEMRTSSVEGHLSTPKPLTSPENGGSAWLSPNTQSRSWIIPTKFRMLEVE